MVFKADVAVKLRHRLKRKLNESFLPPQVPPAGSYLLSSHGKAVLNQLLRSWRSLRLQLRSLPPTLHFCGISLRKIQISVTKEYVKKRKPAATYFPAKVQYHRRKRAWLPCSVWERVLPLHYGHRHLLPDYQLHAVNFFVPACASYKVS